MQQINYNNTSETTNKPDVRFDKRKVDQLISIIQEIITESVSEMEPDYLLEIIPNFPPEMAPYLSIIIFLFKILKLAFVLNSNRNS
jgi:hypothetical protein